MPTNINIWHRWERGLLIIFLLSRTWILIARFGQSWGFDPGAHLWMLEILSWKTPIVGIRESFFSYHPPMGFLLPRSLMLIGFSDVVSVQLVSFAASLIAFFFLRATLKHLNLLYHPVSIVFLYITSSIPLQVYMSASINFDVIILACATVVLYCSIRLFWLERKHSVLLFLAIIATLAFAMLTKFNGIVLLALPVLTALFAPTKIYKLKAKSSLFTRVTAASLLSILSFTTVFPYYYNRYYSEEGTFFPSNNDGWIEEYRNERDKDRFTFIKNQLLAPLARAEGTAIEDFDFEGVRLYETWNGIWARTTWYRAQSVLSVAVSKTYRLIMPIFVFAGFLAMYPGEKRRPSPWTSLAVVLVTFSLLTLASSTAFVYTYPYAPWHPAKTIYASSILFGIGIFLAHILYLPLHAPRFLKNNWHRVQKGMLVAVGMFMVINHVIPVY